MGYRLIKGSFHLFYIGERLVGSRPDGDSIWFKPDRPNLLNNIGGRNGELNGGGFAQLRFEGIDALELHYAGSNHQLEEPTVAARDHLLEMLGFDDIQYAPSDGIDTAVRSCHPVQVPGYILTRAIDPFGRPVAFVFQGTTHETDGSEVWLEPPRLRRSINARLMGAGHVYPGYYTGLPADLRNELTYQATRAWLADRGVWPLDTTNSGAAIANQAALSQRAIWPKLYRRLLKYFLDGNSSLSGFENWLRQSGEDRDDQLWIIPTAELGNLHDVIEISGSTLTMRYWPEELVIVPR